MNMDLEMAEEALMASKLSLIRKVRAGNKVKRYHTVDLIVGETIGHHSANVAMLCLIIADNPTMTLLAAALSHDLAEQHTGDIPAQAKWASQDLARAVKELEGRYKMFQHDLTDDEAKVLKQADMLDLCYKCLEELHMGNALILPILRRGLKFLKDNQPSPTVLYLIGEIDHELR